MMLARVHVFNMETVDFLVLSVLVSHTVAVGRDSIQLPMDILLNETIYGPEYSGEGPPQVVQRPLNTSKPTVYRALARLEEQGYLTVSKTYKDTPKTLGIDKANVYTVHVDRILDPQGYKRANPDHAYVHTDITEYLKARQAAYVDSYKGGAAFRKVKREEAIKRVQSRPRTRK